MTLYLGLLIGLVVGLFAFILIIPQLYEDNKKYGGVALPLDNDTVERVLRLGGIESGKLVFDIGSRSGQIAIASAHVGAKAVALETNPLRAFYTSLWLPIMGLSSQVVVTHKPLTQVDLTKADVVAVFVDKSDYSQLQDKLEKELKPGACVISHSWAFKNWQHDRLDKNVGSFIGPLYGYLAPIKTKH